MVASTSDLRQGAFTNGGPKSNAAKRHREIMGQQEEADLLVQVIDALHSCQSEAAKKEEAGLEYVKLRFINAEAKKLHQAHNTESRHRLQKTFEDVHCVVKRAAAALPLNASFDTATKCNSTYFPNQKHSIGTSSRSARILALRTLWGMSACREDFRELCRSLDICLSSDEVDAVLPAVQDENRGTVVVVRASTLH